MTSLNERLRVFDGPQTRALFVSSTHVSLLDHTKVPYELDRELEHEEVNQLRAAHGGPALFWTRSSAGREAAAMITAADSATAIPVFARILDDVRIQPLLAERGGIWRPVRTLVSEDGSALGSIWREAGGSVFLPFDPDEVLLNYWSERYLRIASGAKIRDLRRLLRVIYYRARPWLPRSFQIWLRRRFARLQARSLFPRWPIETCFHDFLDLMLAILSDVAGTAIPRIAEWPNGHTWALVLTHDVEQAEGLAAIEPVVELERAHGLRSAWNLVPRRYAVAQKHVIGLLDRGFEVGVHGPYHDGRDLESFATWRERLPVAHAAAARWDAAGFRSAALHRDWELMRLLGFDYDSSSPDTDPYEPQEGGCCTWYPYFNGELVELPLTLPQDHTLFVILRQQDEAAWVEKAAFLRDRGGLALIDTHPDYLIDERIYSAYARFLDRFSTDETAWKALPREVSAWWRRRAASRLERAGDGWRIVGPASGEARIVFEEGSW